MPYRQTTTRPLVSVSITDSSVTPMVRLRMLLRSILDCTLLAPITIARFISTGRLAIGLVRYRVRA